VRGRGAARGGVDAIPRARATPGWIAATVRLVNVDPTIPLVIRTLEEGDLDAIESFEPAGQGFVRAVWARQHAGRSTLLVAWHGAEPIGSGEIAWDGAVPELRNLAVRAPHRGSGVGSALIAAAERHVGSGRLLEIGVGDDNPGAAALYLRLGYRPTGARVTTTYFYIDDESVRRCATEVSQMLVKRV